MWKILQSIKKNLIIAIMVSMTLGLVTGYYFDLSPLKVLILPLTMFMIYPMMVNLKISELAELKNFKLLLTALIINFTILPFVAYYIGVSFFENTSYILAFVIIASLPTSGMTISWTGFAKGSIKDAVKMTILGLLMGSMLLPVYIRIFLGASVSISILSILRQVSLVVIVPLLLGNLTRKLIMKVAGKEAYHSHWKKKLPLLSSLGLVIIIFTSMALKSKSIISNPAQILAIILPLALLYLAGFAISSIIGKLFFCRRDSVALVYGTALRNLSIAMGLSVTLFREQAPSIIMVISIAYIIQVQASAWFLSSNERILRPISLKTREKCLSKLKTIKRIGVTR